MPNRSSHNFHAKNPHYSSSTLVLPIINVKTGYNYIEQVKSAIFSRIEKTAIYSTENFDWLDGVYGL